MRAMKTTGWLVLTVLGMMMLFAGELNAGWLSKFHKKKFDYTAKPYKFHKYKAPKAPKVRIRKK
jgi:hypothetical protein